mgnify:CR=1 FL=1|tara:strand:- start:460 stop:612 length:153 start_codon:yes stop_codon:yes gene_type:complete
MTVYERIIIEMKEMEGYDISDTDLRNYTKDRIRQQCEKISQFFKTERENE